MINNVRKDIWVNSYPIFLWLALEPIVGLIDSKIASVINLETLSAIGIGETIYFVFIWVFIFLAYGTTPLVSSLNTKKEINQLNYFIKFGRNVSVILGLGSFFILFLSSDYLISTFQPTDNIQLLSSDYLIYRCIGLPFYLVNMHSTAVLRGLKYAKITFYSALIVSISNIVFSLFFGLFLGLGAGGIGFASSLAFFCASIYSTMILKKQLNHYPSNQENIEASNQDESLEDKLILNDHDSDNISSDDPNGLENFNLDSQDPQLFDENQNISSDHEVNINEDSSTNEEDELEIPAFLRRQKN